MANLTHWIERFLEEQFHWQIVDLQEPLDELHDAPILYITADSVPKFTDDDKKKLRQFTDTGGTVLVEASCGNAAVRDWFTNASKGFAKEIWPEWNLTKLPKEHATYRIPNPLTQVPEILGLDDGVRTFVFYCPEDVSCHWQTKAVAAKEYLFKWGINLYTYATDQAPLRAKLVTKELSKDRYKDPVKAGGTTSLKVARMRYGGDWWVGANYNAFAGIAKVLKERAAVTLEVKEPTAAPITDGGVAPTDLKGNTAAYMAGSHEFTLAQADKDALKAYVDGGGFLWAEAVDGSPKFERGVPGPRQGPRLGAQAPDEHRLAHDRPHGPRRRLQPDAGRPVPPRPEDESASAATSPSSRASIRAARWWASIRRSTSSSRAPPTRPAAASATRWTTPTPWPSTSFCI